MAIDVGEEISTSRQFEKDMSVLTRVKFWIRGGENIHSHVFPAYFVMKDLV